MLPSKRQTTVLGQPFRGPFRQTFFFWLQNSHPRAGLRLRPSTPESRIWIVRWPLELLESAACYRLPRTRAPSLGFPTMGSIGRQTPCPWARRSSGTNGVRLGLRACRIPPAALRLGWEAKRRSQPSSMTRGSRGGSPSSPSGLVTAIPTSLVPGGEGARSR